METCEKVIEQATKKGEYKPQLQLFTKVEGGGTQSTGAHKVKLASSRVVKGTDFQTKAERFEVELTVEEKGVNKTYNFPVKNRQGGVHYLVERFAPLKEGTEVVLEGKKSGKASYVDVKVADGQGKVSEVNIEDIPTIEEDENINKTPTGDEDVADTPKEDEIPF